MIVFSNGLGSSVSVPEVELLAIAKERIAVLQAAVEGLKRMDNFNYLGIVKATLELNKSLIVIIEANLKKRHPWEKNEYC